MSAGARTETPESPAAAAARGGVLAGVRVVDLSRLVAGNMLSLQLADFGADVIKIESPREGDTLRAWREALPDGGTLDAWWRVYGRNKRSVALDPRDADALAALRRLIAGARVLVESFRPGTLEAMGLAPATLHAENPGLVIVRVSGWGQTGPYRDLPGFGSLLEGFGGYAHKHAVDGVPRLPNMALADMVAGLSGAFATLVALREVEVNGGAGQVVDLSLLEPMLSVIGPDATVAAATGRLPESAVKIASPRGVYRCSDGLWVAMSGSTDAMARRVLEAIGRHDLLADPRFASNASRLANDAALDAAIAEAIGRMNRPACLALFRGAGVTVGPVYDARSLLDDAHVVGRGCFETVGEGEGEGAGTVMPAVAPRLSATPGAIRAAAPALGADTARVLEDAGVAPDAIAAMARRGAVRCR